MVDAMTGFNSKRDAVADKNALFEKFEVAQPAQKIPYPVTGWKVEVRGSNQRLFITGVYGDTIFVDLPEAQPVQPVQEPVAWAVQGCSKMWRGEFAEIDAKAEAKRIGGTCVAYALYTAPPKRNWVGLTDEETQAYWDWEDWQTGAGRSTIFEMVRDIEAKLKEKNNE